MRKPKRTPFIQAASALDENPRSLDCRRPVSHPLTYWRNLNMKKSLINSLVAILVLSATAAMAQQKAMDGMKSMPMDGMKDMPMGKPAAGQTVHMAKGKVTKVDAAAGVVTLAHEPVKSLNWPAMTMGFQVKDKMMLDSLMVGKTVDFEFAQADKGYVITKVR